MDLDEAVPAEASAAAARECSVLPRRHPFRPPAEAGVPYRGRVSEHASVFTRGTRKISAWFHSEQALVIAALAGVVFSRRRSGDLHFPIRKVRNRPHRWQKA